MVSLLNVHKNKYCWIKWILFNFDLASIKLNWDVTDPHFFLQATSNLTKKKVEESQHGLVTWGDGGAGYG